MKKIISIILFPFMLVALTYPPSRTPCFPFISGDTFRACCDYAFDEITPPFDPLTVQPHSAIFVKTDFLDQFFKEMHPQIPYPYVLVTHNSDLSAPGSFIRFLDEGKIIAWFGQNMDRVHPKMHPIPIGIANRCWPHGNGDILANVISKQLSKNHCLHINFAVGTFPEERQLVMSLFTKAPFAYKAPQKSYMGYLEDLASCQFCASPRGNGIDTHRLWEALYLGSIPVVKSSSLDPLYTQFPIIIVQNWHDVSESFLRSKASEISVSSLRLDKLYITYWNDLIHSLKNEY